MMMILLVATKIGDITTNITTVNGFYLILSHLIFSFVIQTLTTFYEILTQFIHNLILPKTYNSYTFNLNEDIESKLEFNEKFTFIQIPFGV